MRDTSNSVYAGDYIEVMKQTGFGAKGHIAIGTNSVDKAASYLERQGITLNQDTIRKDENGNMIFVYLKDEIAGFALHLIQRK